MTGDISEHSLESRFVTVVGHSNNSKSAMGNIYAC